MEAWADFKSNIWLVLPLGIVQKFMYVGESISDDKHASDDFHQYKCKVYQNDSGDVIVVDSKLSSPVGPAGKLFLDFREAHNYVIESVDLHFDSYEHRTRVFQSMYIVAAQLPSTCIQRMLRVPDSKAVSFRKESCVDNAEESGGRPTCGVPPPPVPPFRPCKGSIHG